MNEQAIPRTQAELDAEAQIVGAILSAGSLDVAAGHRLLERIEATGLDPHDFYVRSLGRLYAALVELRDRGISLDPVSVAYELEQSGAEASTRGRLEALAHTSVATTPAARWAEIVARAGRMRRAG